MQDLCRITQDLPLGCTDTSCGVWAQCCGAQAPGQWTWAVVAAGSLVVVCAQSALAHGCRLSGCGVCSKCTGTWLQALWLWCVLKVHWHMVAVCGLGLSTVCGIFVSWPGIEPAFFALQGRLLTTGPQSKCQHFTVNGRKKILSERNLKMTKWY